MYFSDTVLQALTEQ